MRTWNAMVRDFYWFWWCLLERGLGVGSKFRADNWTLSFFISKFNRYNFFFILFFHLILDLTRKIFIQIFLELWFAIGIIISCRCLIIRCGCKVIWFPLISYFYSCCYFLLFLSSLFLLHFFLIVVAHHWSRWLFFKFLTVLRVELLKSICNNLLLFFPGDKLVERGYGV